MPHIELESDVQPLPDHSESLWRAESPTVRPALGESMQVDVAVIGAGITGLVAAVLVARTGRRVLVIEDRSIGAGATGFSTAKVTALHGLKYSMLTRRHGPAVAARYAQAQQMGLAWLQDRWPAMEPAAAMTYATDDATLTDVEAEVGAAVAAGLPARFVDRPDLPFETRGAVALEDQGQVAPLPLLASLADEVEALGGQVVEGTRALAVRGGWRRPVVETTGGDVRADWVIAATGLPFLDRSLLFARTEARCSYVIAVRASDPLPAAMFLSAGEPTRSLRTAPDRQRPGERLLLVGGESHKTGADPKPSRRYEALLTWATERFDVQSVAYKWSTEDFVPDDGLPFVGPVWPLPTRTLVATGYAKWGFTSAVAAAKALTARIAGDESPEYAKDWDTRRFDLPRGAKEAARANADVAVKLVAGWTGAVARTRSLRPTAAAPVDGRVEAVSAVCTHLGGIVRWNDGDGCWDCPLHGSRFAADGALVHGPAVRDLKRHSLATEDRQGAEKRKVTAPGRS
jgi:glycine/D-amino acid oxidase-like deaminating enzyme/nitrite reductase/ring-hydroxylating ferredoxin subunit